MTNRNIAYPFTHEQINASDAILGAQNRFVKYKNPDYAVHVLSPAPF